MKMKCEKVQPNLLDYGKGLLEAPESQKIKAHIEHCVECKAILEEELAFSAQLSALPEEQPVNDVWAAIALRTKPKELRPMIWLTKLFATNLRRAVAATATTAVLIAALYSYQPIDQKPTINNGPKPVTAVKWSDDPLGEHTDATIELIAKL